MGLDATSSQRSAVVGFKVIWRQPEAELTTAAGALACPHVTAHRLHQAPADIQTDPGTTGSPRGSSRAEEWPEQRLTLRRRHPGAAIEHAHDGAGFLLAGLDPDEDGLGEAVLGSVGDEVACDLLHAGLVAGDHRKPASDLQLDVDPGPTKALSLHHDGDDALEQTGFPDEVDTFVEMGQHEQVVDESEQMLGLLRDVIDQLGPLTIRQRG